MAGGTREWGPGRLQCDLCFKWFRPAGLGGHKRFYHDLWKQQLRSDVLTLANQVRDRGPLPERFGYFIDHFGSLDEGQLLFCKEQLQAKLPG